MREGLFVKSPSRALFKNFIYNIFLLYISLQYTLPLNIQIIDNRTNITPTLLMNPQPFLFNLCYPHNPTFGTKTRFKGCTITAIILSIIHSSCRAFSQHDGLYDCKNPLSYRGNRNPPRDF